MLSLDQLKVLRITQVEWNGVYSLGVTLRDGQYCGVGKPESISMITHSHKFNPAKKITRIESIIHFNEYCIVQINFYSGEERLVAVGETDDWVKEYGKRRAIFKIDKDE